MINILVIHNEESMRDIFSKILVPRGYKITGVKSGNEGLRLSEKQEFDLVFVASHLDDIDGVKVLELFNRQNRELPVVLCCGMHELDSAVEAVKKGAYDFIEEPYKNSDILKISQEILVKTGKGTDAAVHLQENQYLKDAAKKKLFQIAGIAGAILIVAAIIIDIVVISNRKKAEKIELELAKINEIKQKVAEEKVKKEVSVKKTENIPVLAVKKSEPEKGVLRDKAFEVPYTHPSGLCRSGEFVYVCDWFSQNVYKHKADENFTLVKTYSVGDLHPSGLAVINDYLWVSDSWDGTVTKFKIDSELVLVKTFKVKEQNPSGLVYDGANLWLCDAAAKKIGKHWMDNDLTLNTFFAAPGESPAVLYWDGRNLWSGDRDAGVVFYHKSSVTLQDFDKFQNETLRTKRGKFSAFAGDKDYYWMAFDGTGSIYRFEAGKFRSK